MSLDFIQTNVCRQILDSVGKPLLASVVADCRESFSGGIAVYEETATMCCSSIRQSQHGASYSAADHELAVKPLTTGKRPARGAGYATTAAGMTLHGCPYNPKPLWMSPAEGGAQSTSCRSWRTAES